MLVADGVQEITLLGQNVNAYGVDFGDRSAFAKLLRRCGEVPGLERVRFTSPHPKDFTDEVIAAMAETPNVMPSLHMPLQSGSDAVLRAMRRSYRSERYPGHPRPGPRGDARGGDHHRHHRRAFPGRPRADFQATLDVVAAARFAGAFTFQYSIRPGTPAATMPDQVPKPVVQERYDRLVALVDEIAWRENQTQVGRRVEVMFAAGEGRKDAATARMSGRARDNRLVHVAVPDDPARRRVPATSPRWSSPTPPRTTSPPTPACLASGAPRGGDAWAASQSTSDRRPPVSLGLPAVGLPPPLPSVSCASG